MIAIEKFAILRAATFQIIDFHCKFQTKSCTDNQSKVIWIMLDQFQFQMQLNNLKCKTKKQFICGKFAIYFRTHPRIQISLVSN